MSFRFSSRLPGASRSDVDQDMCLEYDLRQPDFVLYYDGFDTSDLDESAISDLEEPGIFFDRLEKSSLNELATSDLKASDSLRYQDVQVAHIPEENYHHERDFEKSWVRWFLSRPNSTCDQRIVEWEFLPLIRKADVHCLSVVDRYRRYQRRNSDDNAPAILDVDGPTDQTRNENGYDDCDSEGENSWVRRFISRPNSMSSQCVWIRRIFYSSNPRENSPATWNQDAQANHVPKGDGYDDCDSEYENSWVRRFISRPNSSPTCDQDVIKWDLSLLNYSSPHECGFGEEHEESTCSCCG